MNNITREDLERIVERLKKSESKKKVCWVAGTIAAVIVIAVTAVFLYKKLTPDPDEFEDDFDDDEFFEDFEDELKEEPEAAEEADDEDIFVDEEAEAKKAAEE
ncbi:MAG: hypothetical protein PUG60_00545 [Lachnospiraceae bacterium]|nr:hypothetical protein [Lachnospiraceae bacterium]MDY4969616.1 hypothetical protein [Lachnospiraceae bacterium]